VKVYIVTSGTYSSYGIEAVFLSKAVAERYLEERRARLRKERASWKPADWRDRIIDEDAGRIEEYEAIGPQEAALTLEDVQRIEKKGRWRAWYERQTPERQREVGRRAREAGRKR